MDGYKAAATLVVDRNADQDEVRRAFRAQAKRLHPDAGPDGSGPAFMELREAFDQLMATAPKAVPATRWSKRPPVSPPFEIPSSAPRSALVDLTDAPRRQRRPSSDFGSADIGRHARGRSFADHLASALAR